MTKHEARDSALFALKEVVKNINAGERLSISTRIAVRDAIEDLESVKRKRDDSTGATRWAATVASF